jgi:hypothetical protein
VSEDEKPTGMTIRLPAPRAVAEAVASDRDPRTAEVLRALHRARGTVIETKDLGTSKVSEKAAAGLQREIHLLREALSKAALLPDEMAQRLASRTRTLEQSLVMPGAALADLQRTYESVARVLGDSGQLQRQQTDRLAAWHAWWRRQVALWTLVLGVLFVVGGAVLCAHIRSPRARTTSCSRFSRTRRRLRPAKAQGDEHAYGRSSRS